MRKGSELIGNEVLTDETKGRFRKIEDLIFDSNRNEVLGFLVDEGGWFSDAEVLPLENVKAFEPHRVIVPTRNAVVKASQTPEMKAILERNNVMKDTKLVTADNRELGTLVDLYFSERTGQIEGYEVQGGHFAREGFDRWFIPAGGPLKISDNVAVVPTEVLDQMDEQPLNPFELTRGRRVRTMVVTKDGDIIAAPGQIVTDKIMARARTYGMEDALVDAVGVDVPEANGPRVRDILADERDAPRERPRRVPAGRTEVDAKTSEVEGEELRREKA